MTSVPLGRQERSSISLRSYLAWSIQPGASLDGAPHAETPQPQKLFSLEFLVLKLLSQSAKCSSAKSSLG